MTHSVGIDVSLETSSICIVDQTGRVVRELTAETEPEALAMALLHEAPVPAPLELGHELAEKAIRQGADEILNTIAAR